MKKNIKMVLGAFVLAGALLVTGCGNSAKTGEGASSAEMSDIDVASVGTEVEASEVYDIFSKSLENVDAAKSITVSTDTNLTMSDASGEVTSKENVILKKMSVDDEYKVGVDMSSVYNDPSSESGEVSNQINATFDDGYLYFESEGQKLKEAMTYDDLIGIINRYTLSVSAETMSKALVAEDGDNKVYYVEFDKDNISKLMEDNMSSFGSAFSDDENMEIKTATLKAEFDKDSNIVCYDFSLEAEYTNTSEETPSVSPFNYNIVAKFYDLDNTTVALPEDEDAYTDVAEMQTEATDTEAQSGASDAEAVAPTDGTGAETEAVTAAQ